jgi:hypothetical protein
VANRIAQLQGLRRGSDRGTPVSPERNFRETAETFKVALGAPTAECPKLRAAIAPVRVREAEGPVLEQVLTILHDLTHNQTDTTARHRTVDPLQASPSFAAHATFLSNVHPVT